MDKVQAVLYKIFGASWFTSVLGYIVMTAGIAQLIQEYLATNSVPTNLSEWITFITGIAIRASKQANVSNSQNPLAVAQPIVVVPGQPLAEKPMPIVVK